MTNDVQRGCARTARRVLVRLPESDKYWICCLNPDQPVLIACSLVTIVLSRANNSTASLYQATQAGAGSC